MLVFQLNVVYCNNDRAIIPCYGMTRLEMEAELDALRSRCEVFHAWITMTTRRR